MLIYLEFFEQAASIKVYSDKNFPSTRREDTSTSVPCPAGHHHSSLCVKPGWSRHTFTFIFPSLSVELSVDEMWDWNVLYFLNCLGNILLYFREVKANWHQTLIDRQSVSIPSQCHYTLNSASWTWDSFLVWLISVQYDFVYLSDHFNKPASTRSLSLALTAQNPLQNML